VLPGPKVTIEIASARGVAPWVDCISPASHSAFSTPVEMMQFIDRPAHAVGGKPDRLQLCIGHPWEWFASARPCSRRITPDFIVVDGAEGGTGAAPLEFTDHVGAPLQEGLLLVHNTLVGLALRDKVKLGCAARWSAPSTSPRMMALGADWCTLPAVSIFAGLHPGAALHTGMCPTGVSTQDPRASARWSVPTKAERV